MAKPATAPVSAVCICVFVSVCVCTVRVAGGDWGQTHLQNLASLLGGWWGGVGVGWGGTEEVKRFLC